jgi:imidazolonepropionase-like amidohydrolase
MEKAMRFHCGFKKITTNFLLKLFLFFMVINFYSCSCQRQLIKTSEKIMKSSTNSIYAFKDVNVIAMDSERILQKQTVIIENGLINEIQDADKIIIPENAKIIEAKGQYLIPGLIDMHVHISDDKDIFDLLSHGVTTVRNMADVPGWVKFFMGFSDVLLLKKKIQERKLLGPTIYTPGLVLDGEKPVSPFNKVIKNAKDAEKEIKKQDKAGTDCIKIYDMLADSNFSSILQIAKRYNKPVIGHVPFDVGIDKVLQSSVLSIEHLTGYVSNNVPAYLISENEISIYAEKTKKAGIWNCPTLVIYENIPPQDSFQVIKKQPEYKRLSWRIKWLWKTSMKYVYKEYKGNDYKGEMRKITMNVVKALHEAGCPLLVGTDMNFLGVYPGIATHREMELLTEAGLSPYEALQAATYNAAQCLGKLYEIGTISPGKQADLVLLGDNPLENISNTHKINGVMINGIWLDRDDIKSLID